jgi:5-formyltetrahydrofolate cyclo-ligase
MKLKSELREYAMTYRNSLDEESYMNLSLAITYKLCYMFPFKEAYDYHFFIGAPFKREIFTKPLIDVLLKSGRNVFVPKVTSENTLSTHKIHTVLDLKPGAFGIEEPITFENETKDFDCIIVPMLAGDKTGNRVGYGRGFYDRFLKNATGVKIGIVYDSCLVDQVESEEHDIPLDLIITENRVIETNRR